MIISIIVPTYNRNEILVNTLRSIINEIENCSVCNIIELIVVDQSTSHTEEVNSFLQKCNNLSYFIYVKEKVASLPNARNVGLLKASGEIVLFLDDDVLLCDNFFSKLVNGYHDECICSVVGGITVVNKDGNILLNNQSFLKKAAKRILSSILGLGKPFFISKIGFIISNPESSKETIVDMGFGCNMSFKKEVFNTVGLFDVNYRGNALREETDLFFRIKSNHGKVLFKPDMHLQHVMANTGGCRNDINEEYWRTYFYNQCYFYIKNFNFSLHRIKIILLFDYIKCRRNGFDIDNIIKDAYKEAQSLLIQ